MNYGRGTTEYTEGTEVHGKARNEDGFMELRLKVVAGVCLAIIAAVVLAWVASEANGRHLGRAVESAKQQAKASDEAATVAESAAGEYRKKIEYLENELAAIGQIARRQDEELEKIGGDVNTARRDVERARSIRAIDATADELCRKLAELGHGCQ